MNPGPLRSARRLPVMGFALLTVGVVAAGVLLDRSMRQSARRQAGAELDAVAALKVASVVAWRDDKLQDTAFGASYPSVERAAQAAAAGAPDKALAGHAVEVLVHLAARQGFSHLALHAADGRTLLEWTAPGKRSRAFPGTLLERARTSASGAVDLLDEGGTSLPWLETAVPIQVAGAPPAVLAMRCELGRLFETLVGTWPVPSETGGAALMHIEGEKVHLLGSPSQFGGKTTMEVPLSDVNRAAVRVIRGGEGGALEGRDWRGTPILVAARPIPGTDWWVRTKKEIREVEAPLIRPALVIFSLLSALVLVGAAMLGLWWRQEGARARVEEALRESEARFRLALAGTHFVWDWDLAAGRLEVDAGWAKAMGRTERSVEGTPRQILDFICHPDDVAAVEGRFMAHLRGEVPSTDAEFRTELADGSVRWVQVRGQASRRDEAGRAQRMTGVVTDITERRALQAHLERSERMASLGTLAAGLAHEVNNPLASVLVNLEVLQRELGADGRPVVAELLAETRDGAERVRDVVRSLRAFARPGAERRVVESVRAEIEAAVRLSRNELRHRARLEVRIGDLPPVEAAEHQLGQVFLNLLTNAAQAIPEGHAEENLITLEAGTGRDGWARVEVRDTGAGIAPEVLKRIFEPFFTTKAQGVGTGLGLAIVHSIVQAAGGRLEVESQLGSGSTFRVLLPPAAGPVAPRRPAATPPPGQGGGRRVLVVDDDPLVARALVRVLRRRHQVTAISSGEEALARLEAGERFDAILCDLMMPQMSGMELHARLVERHPGQARRMIFLTGGAFTEAAHEFLRRVPCACLEKPVEPAQLIEAIERVASGGQADAVVP